MRRDGPLVGHRQARRPVLRWKTPDGRGQECPVTPDRPVTIGRESRNTIVLDSRAVSKAHAIIELRNGEYTVQDLESANGTRVNGDPTSVRVLEPGDEIIVGDVPLSFVDLGGDDPSGAPGAGTSGSMKMLKLAGAAGLTLVVMLSAMSMLLHPPGSKRSASRSPVAEAPLAPATAEVMTMLKTSAEASLVVQDTLKDASLGGVPAVQALFEEGLVRLENKRWREAAQLMAAVLSRDPKHPRAGVEFERAAAELDRAASRALAAAEQAQAGLQFEDALLRADEVLMLLDSSDARHERASRIAEQARTRLRQR